MTASLPDLGGILLTPACDLTLFASLIDRIAFAVTASNADA